MSLSRLSNRYAKSLKDLALEMNRLDVINTNMDMVNATILSSDDLTSMLRSPIVNRTKKKAVLHALFENRVDELMMKFIDLLLSKNRERYLLDIARVFKRLYNEYKNIKPVTIVTAVDIDDSIREKLVKKLTGIVNGASIELTSEIDTDLIGGFILRFDDWQYDASIEHKMQIMRKAFDSNVYVKKY